MANVPVTPRRPSTSARVPSANLPHASPHYVTTRRHSLYGVEDRIIIDPGSRIWKVGFSGEGRPRDVFYANKDADGNPLWALDVAADKEQREEDGRILHVRLEKILRSVFHDSLLTDPKSRKVILVEHPLLPLSIKEVLVRILFDNLQVPSISFATSHLLSLCSYGRITGLVLDCGHLESITLPIFSARPLYSNLKTTPLAGHRLTSHLRALLLMFGTYLPPPTSLVAAANIPAASRSTRVPEEVLTDSVVEYIKTSCLFVGKSMSETHRETSASESRDDLSSDIDMPPSSEVSESEFSSQAGRESNVSSHQPSSEFSIISHPRIHTQHHHPDKNENHLQAIASMYKRHSTATDLKLRVQPPASQQTGTGLGTLVIPGWIRERAAEVLFEGGDVDESSLPEIILDSLLKTPVDLRKTLSSSVLVSGGTSMLPGFASRLHSELLALLSSAPSLPTQHPTRNPRRRTLQVPPYDRYASLRQLARHVSVLNNPAPRVEGLAERAASNAGKCPAFAPATSAWVGASLAGALKIGGHEISREKWDEAHASPPSDFDESSADLLAVVHPPMNARSVLPDWSSLGYGPSGAGQSIAVS